MGHQVYFAQTQYIELTLKKKMVAIFSDKTSHEKKEVRWSAQVFSTCGYTKVCFIAENCDRYTPWIKYKNSGS